MLYCAQQSKVGLLPALLLPLAGPEDLDDEENEALPTDLQYISRPGNHFKALNESCRYLPPDKTRESDPDIRKMLLEAMLQVEGNRMMFLFSFILMINSNNKSYCQQPYQLCATRFGRETLRNRKIYPILRFFPCLKYRLHMI